MTALALVVWPVVSAALMAAICLLGRARADGPRPRHRRRDGPPVHIPAQRQAPDLEQIARRTP